MPADIIHNSHKGEIILYQPDETILKIIFSAAMPSIRRCNVWNSG